LTDKEPPADFVMSQVAASEFAINEVLLAIKLSSGFLDAQKSVPTHFRHTESLFPEKHDLAYL
jgi:hypothetical protein